MLKSEIILSFGNIICDANCISVSIEQYCKYKKKC